MSELFKGKGDSAMNLEERAMEYAENQRNARAKALAEMPVHFTRSDYDQGIETLTRYLVDDEGHTPEEAARKAREHWNRKCPKFASEADA